MKQKLTFKKRYSTYSWIFVISLTIISFMLMTIIHELGHAIAAHIFGFEVTKIDITLTYGRTWIRIPDDAKNYELIFIYLSGTLHTAFWGLLALFTGMILFKYKRAPEIHFIILSLGLSFFLDFFTYVIFDVFWLQFGDFYAIFKIFPSLLSLLMVFASFYLVLFVKYWKMYSNLYRKLDREIILGNF